MKKILLACGALLLLTPAGIAQNRQQPATLQSRSAVTKAKAGSAATVSHMPATQENAGTQQAVPAVQTSKDIIVPDHSYQPAGTAGVGFFGNGTGGSTIGSTPDNGGTGYTPAKAAGGQRQPQAAPQRSVAR